MAKRRKRKLNWFRIILVAVLFIGIVYFVVKSFSFSGKEEEVPAVIMPEWEEDLSPTTNFVNTMEWTDEGIFINGTMASNNGTFELKICSIPLEECKSFEGVSKGAKTYEGTILLGDLENGSYELKINSGKEEKLTDTRPLLEKIARAHIKDKLVTIDYSNDRVKLDIEDFAYEYDILIDPGHGGEDAGSYNKEMDEEKLNLEQALYEKKRYEEHGLKVKLIREDNSYGIMMGDESWSNVRRRAYAMGYYGVVSRVSYSNHHNSSVVKSYSGWEIIVPGENVDISNEKKVASLWEEDYVVRENHLRFYARSEEGGIFSKEEDEVYKFNDYYAVIRIPYSLYHVKNPLYEGSYLSNSLDYDWYYKKDNWKKLSEDKIKTYVEYLGKTYIPV